MREIKFSYIFKAACGDRFFEKILTLDELERDRTLRGPINMNGKLVARRQFTGLKDKNGKEIYEGDVVLMLCTDWPSKSDNDPRTLEEYLRDKADKYVVCYSPDSCMFTLNFGSVGGYQHTFGGFRPHGFVEVIGNIHQNPELLK